VGPQRGRECDDDGATRSCVCIHVCVCVCGDVCARASIYERGLYILSLSRRQPASLVYVPALRDDTHRLRIVRLYTVVRRREERPRWHGSAAPLFGFPAPEEEREGKGLCRSLPVGEGGALSHRETPETLHNAVGPGIRGGEFRVRERPMGLLVMPAFATR